MNRKALVQAINESCANFIYADGGAVYIVGSTKHPCGNGCLMLKIGHTNNLRQRIGILKSAYKARLVHTVVTNSPAFAETVFHRIFQDKRLPNVEGWGREWFRLNESDLLWLMGIGYLDIRELRKRVGVV